jgi:catechol 2,3-dioxygenase-like lactoylglutathione lyase family enzyme
MRLEAVLETALYHDSADRDRIESFYVNALNLPLVAGWSDAMAFRIGGGVLILFDREQIVERDEPQAQHRTSGAGHVCFLVPADEYEDWKHRIVGAGIEVAHEHVWDRGRRSFYFNDPAGNLLEIADGDMWPEGGD